MRNLLAALVFLGLGVVAAAASAHAFLERAFPRVGSTVSGSPEEVRLGFSEELEPAFSTLRVLDAAGRQVDRGDKQLDATDHRVLHVSVPRLPPGSYRVMWRVLSVDAHVTEGDYRFDVEP